MLKDITLGQYFPGNSIIHRLDPRTKLIMLVVYIVALFMATGWKPLQEGNRLMRVSRHLRCWFPRVPG